MVERSEQSVFDAVVALVERGEYLDEMLGLPEVQPTGGGMFRRLPDGRVQRSYERNSAEYREAKAAGLIEPMPSPPYPPADPVAVAEIEDLVGYPMPTLLRRLYLEVANGGFGPGYGVLGIRGGHGVSPEQTALKRYQNARARGGSIPSSLVPVCDWGCAIESYVDWADPDGRMWTLDPNPVEAITDALQPQEMALVEWLALWVQGVLFQPWVLQDPATGAWRSATNEESRALSADDG